MSGIMIDERYEANVNRAAAIANRVSLTLIIMAAILALSLFRIHDSCDHRIRIRPFAVSSGVFAIPLRKRGVGDHGRIYM